MGFGSFVKKAVKGVGKAVGGVAKGVKKVASSKLGKIGLGAAAGYYGGNLLFSPSMLGSTNILGGSLTSLAPENILGGSLSGAGGLFGGAGTGAAGGMFTGLGLTGGDILGGLGAYGAYKGQQDTNAAMIQSVREQMAFQNQMRNTSYQAAVADMKKAGVNPMLAYQQGGAAVPSGASVSNLGNPEGAGVSAAQQARLITGQLENLHSQSGANQASTIKDLAQAEVNKAQVAKVLAEAKGAEASASQSEIELQRKQYLQGWGVLNARDLAVTKAELHSAFNSEYSAQTDLKTRMQLNLFADHAGYDSWDAMKEKLSWNQIQNEWKKFNYSLNEAKSMSNMWGSDYGQNIAPYLNSASHGSSIIDDLLGSAGAAKNLIKKGK